jgi:hypothetical protein
MKNMDYLKEGNNAKAYRVVRKFDKMECVAKILKPTIKGMRKKQIA